jgi:hypothetical protein
MPIMATTNAELKKEFDSKIKELDVQRKTLIQEYKDKIRDAKINKIRNSIINK